MNIKTGDRLYNAIMKFDFTFYSRTMADNNGVHDCYTSIMHYLDRQVCHPYHAYLCATRLIPYDNSILMTRDKQITMFPSCSPQDMWNLASISTTGRQRIGRQGRAGGHYGDGAIMIERPSGLPLFYRFCGRLCDTRRPGQSPASLAHHAQKPNRYTDRQTDTGSLPCRAVVLHPPTRY